MSTIESRISEIRQNATQQTFMRFGTVIPMCKSCGAVRVEDKDDVCIPCVRKIANIERYKADQQQAARQLKLICCGIITFLVITAGAWFWLG